MSILLAAEPKGSLWELWLGAFAALVALGLAKLVGVFRLGGGTAVRRVLPDRPLAPLVGVLFAALVVWQMLPTLYLQRQAAGATPAPATSAPSVIVPATRDLVMLSAVVPAIAFVVLAAGDFFVRPRVRQRLGFNVGRIPIGLAAGLVGILLTLPLVYFAMVSAERVFWFIGYEHSPEHALLRAMRETPDTVMKYLAVVAAVLVAPLWEELLFRGHVQTLFREAFARMREQTPSTGADVAVRNPTRPVESLAAVLLTSLCFAAVHEPWSMPPIFVLSVCLGLAYERTGNLWVPVAMHATFNALMTVYFLYSGVPN